MFPRSLWGCWKASHVCVVVIPHGRTGDGSTAPAQSVLSGATYHVCVSFCVFCYLFVCSCRARLPVVRPSHPRPLISGSPLAERAGSWEGEDQAEAKRGRVRKDGKRRRTDQRCRLYFPAETRTRPKHKLRVKSTPSQQTFK